MIGLLALAAAATIAPADDLQAAIDALPATGGEVRLQPGEYRRKIVIAKPNVRLVGLGRKPGDTVLIWGDDAKAAGGTGKSASVTASGDGFSADNLTIANDYSRDPAHPPSQAVALALTADKAVLTRVRLLGAQDTLYAAGRSCEGDICKGARQYFRDCYIEGHVDFIFGDARAWFDACELHAIRAENVMVTAQSKNDPRWHSAYVFDHARLTIDPTARYVWLGRAWRPYATVVFLNAHMDARLQPAGWREWTPGKTDTLKTATFAEFASTGPGARPKERDPATKLLDKTTAAQWTRDTLFDGWRP